MQPGSRAGLAFHCTLSIVWITELWSGSITLTDSPSCVCVLRVTAPSIVWITEL